MLQPQPPQVQAQAPQAGVPGMSPQALMQTMMQQFMQQLLLSMQQAIPQVAPGTAPVGEAAPAAFSPHGAGWQEDRHLANVRLDERAFRRVEKFTDKREEWTEWRAQVLNAVRECDKTFADNLLVFEKQEEPITDTQLSMTQQQLSATLQSRLISVTGKEAFAIVRAAEGQGVEAWRQLGMRFDPQTDARFALLLSTRDVQNWSKARRAVRNCEVGNDAAVAGKGP